ncbi:MAG: S-layer homology domain-containing protein [Bacillota bacterium]
MGSGRWLRMLALVAAFSLLWATPALAGVIGWVKIDGSKVDPGEAISPKPNNTVRIDVYLNEAPVSLRIGNQDVTVSQGTYAYSVPKYLLRPGTNAVNISARTAGGSETRKYTVTYLDMPLAGAEFYLPDVSRVTKQTMFGGAASLNLGKDTYLMESDGDVPADQSLTVSVAAERPAKAPRGFAGVSPIFAVDPVPTGVTKFSRPGQLVLKFQGGMAPGALPYALTVFRSPDSDFGDEDNVNLGGRVDARKGTVTVPLAEGIEGYYAVFSAVAMFKEFTDPSAGLGWAYHAAYPLWVKGIMEQYYGTAGGSTNPWEYATLTGNNDTYLGLVAGVSTTQVNTCRGEFAVLVVKALGIAPVNVAAGEYSFADLDNDASASREYADQYGGYLEAAGRYGIVVGYPPGGSGQKPEFRALTTLDREQAATIVARVANLRIETDPDRVDAALQKAFSDASSISPWCRPYVLAAYRAGLVKGIPEGGGFKFAPGAYITRAEAAQLIYNFMNKMRLL